MFLFDYFQSNDFLKLTQTVDPSIDAELSLWKDLAAKYKDDYFGALQVQIDKNARLEAELALLRGAPSS